MALDDPICRQVGNGGVRRRRTVDSDQDRSIERGAYDQHRARRVIDDLCRNRAEEHRRERSASTVSDHDEFSATSGRDLDDDARGSADGDRAGDDEVGAPPGRDSPIHHALEALSAIDRRRVSVRRDGSHRVGRRPDDPITSTRLPVGRCNDRTACRAASAANDPSRASSTRIAFSDLRLAPQRAMTTVAAAWVATCSDTLPWSIREMAPSPRDPTTMTS